MHGGERAIVRVLDPEVQALRLAHECPAVRGHVDQVAHRHLPHGLVLVPIDDDVSWILRSTWSAGSYAAVDPGTIFTYIYVT